MSRISELVRRVRYVLFDHRDKFFERNSANKNDAHKVKFRAANCGVFLFSQKNFAKLFLCIINSGYEQ